MKPIKNQLILLILTLLVPMLFLQIYIFNDRFQNRRNAELRANLEVARAVAKTFEAFVMDIVHTELAVGQAMIIPTATDLDCARILDEFITDNPALASAIWVNPAGIIVASSPREMTGVDETDRKSYQHIISGATWSISDLVIGKISDKPIFFIERGIRSPRGELLGVVSATIDPDRLLNVLKIYRSNTGRVGILDSKGMLVHRNPAGELSWEQRNWLKDYPVIKESLESREAVTSLISKFSGSRRLAAFVPIPSLGWVAAASREEADALLAIRSSILPQAYFFLLITIAAFGLALMLSRIVSSSVQKLRDYALVYGGGDAQNPLPPLGIAELDELAGAMNKMIGDIEARERESKLAEDALRESEGKYRLFVETASEWVWALGAEQNVTFMNQIMCDKLGYHMDEMIGRPVTLLLSGDELDDHETKMKLRERGLGETYERKFIRKNGEGLWVIVSAKALTDENGEFKGSFAMGTDITERKRAEQALRESEGLLRLFIEHAPVSLAMFDRKMRYLSVSRRWLTDYNLEARDVIGLSHYKVFPEIPERWKEVHRRGLAGEVIRAEEDRFDRLDGSVQWERWEVRPWFDSSGDVSGIIIFSEDISERKHSEMEILRLYRQNKLILDSTGEGIIGLDTAGKITLANPAAAQMLGYSVDELIGEDLHHLAHHSKADDTPYPLSECASVESLKSGVAGRTSDEVLWKKDGTSFPSAYSSTPITEDDKIIGAVVTFRDITLRRLAEHQRDKLQEQLFQSQKMESVGRLAGGVAHDYNNMLSVIIGRAEMALSQSISNEVHEDLEEILKAGKRSADLTRQLLAFARRQTAAPKVLDLNDTISGMFKMLRRLIGEDIHLSWMPGLDLWDVKIDPSQVDQILANLAVNARDAISGIGTVTIKTENVAIDQYDRTGAPEFIAGDCVLLTVSDTGMGMSREVSEKIFEPFFTTKQLGKGSGLGLSTVYGIVKQNDGFIFVASQQGEGTTIKIYLPRCSAESEQTDLEDVAFNPPTGKETILLVEDDEAVLNLSRMMLERLGYTVLVAHTPSRAMQTAEDHQGDLDLLITDVVMPEMNGRELVERLRAVRPGLKCLFMSGYTADVIARQGVLDEGVNFIQKPFVRDDFAGRVREVLDHPV